MYETHWVTCTNVFNKFEVFDSRLRESNYTVKDQMALSKLFQSMSVTVTYYFPAVPQQDKMDYDSSTCGCYAILFAYLTTIRVHPQTVEVRSNRELRQAVKLMLELEQPDVLKNAFISLPSNSERFLPPKESSYQVICYCKTVFFPEQDTDLTFCYSCHKPFHTSCIPNRKLKIPEYKQAYMCAYCSKAHLE